MSRNPWMDELNARKGREVPMRKTPLPSLKDLKRIIAKTPEVMFKVSRSAIESGDKPNPSGKVSHKTVFPSPRNTRALKGVAQYISRNGATEMMDETGLIFSGKHAVKDAIEGWGLPEESDKKQALHIMMGMPAETADGSLTDVAAVFRANEEAAKKLFGNHMYLIAHHQDSDGGHPHSHLIVKVESKSGKRINPKKRDLARYRETLAQKLRDNGVEANATSKVARLSTRRNLSHGEMQAIKKDDDPERKARRLNHGITDAHVAQFTEYLNAARQMKDSADPDKQALSQGLTGYLSNVTGIAATDVETEVQREQPRQRHKP